MIELEKESISKSVNLSTSSTPFEVDEKWDVIDYFFDEKLILKLIFLKEFSSQWLG